MIVRAVPSGSMAPDTFKLMTVPPPIAPFGMIDPFDLGVKISGPRSPTRYDVPRDTGPPLALPPPNTLSIAPPIAWVTGLLESGLTENHNFIPMISVKLPYINQLGYNATLKLDDKDFRATNPGVWCHSLHTLQKRSVFTDWSKYTKDEPL